MCVCASVNIVDLYDAYTSASHSLTARQCDRVLCKWSSSHLSLRALLHAHLAYCKDGNHQ